MVALAMGLEEERREAMKEAWVGGGGFWVVVVVVGSGPLERVRVVVKARVARDERA